MVGCADSETHSTIGKKMNYEGFEHLVYGVSVNKAGIVTLFNKGQSPRILPNIGLKVGDIVELTLHSKQSTLIITKYSSAE